MIAMLGLSIDGMCHSHEIRVTGEVKWQSFLPATR
jgi:hypothetical protein